MVLVVIQNLAAIEEWAERENPSFRTWRIVERFVATLEGNPWGLSRPLSLGTGDPWEMRIIDVPGAGVEVIYEHEHATGAIRLLQVGSSDPSI
jgi:hypothetical protein